MLTNYVWHGLTFTKRNPAIQTSFHYNLSPIVKVGMWGSNVSFYGPNQKSNAVLKLLFDIKIPFNNDYNMSLRFNDNHYFESSDHDGTTFILDFGIYSYNFGLENESNWRGEVTKTKYYYLEKTWDVFGRWKWENHIGYTQFETLDAGPYFDVKTGIGTNISFAFCQLALTFTDDNSRWGPWADYFFTFSGSARF